MSNDRWIVEVVEDALDEHPLCRVCGSPFDVVARDGRLWLVCKAIDESPSLLRRVAQAIAGHDRIVIAWLPEPAAEAGTA